MASQTKVEFYHGFMAGVVGPHGCEDFTNGAEVLLDQSLLDGLPMGGQKSSTDVLGKKLE